MRVFMSLSEKEVAKFDNACKKACMTRSQYLSFLLGKRTDLRPPVLRYRELIQALESIDKDLKVIAMKDVLSEDEKIFVMQKISDTKDMLSERLKGESANGDRG